MGSVVGILVHAPKMGYFVLFQEPVHALADSNEPILLAARKITHVILLLIGIPRGRIHLHLPDRAERFVFRRYPWHPVIRSWPPAIPS